MAGPEMLLPMMAGGIMGMMGGRSGGGSMPAPVATPAPIPPAAQPTTPKPKATGMQQSFLSSVAGGGLPGQAGGSSVGGANGGKTLLGS